MTKKPTSKQKITKAHCPNCGPQRNCREFASHEYKVHDDYDGVWMSYLHQMYKCRGCDLVFHTRTEVFSENIHPIGYDWKGDYIYDEDATIYSWPAISKREKPSWVNKINDETLSNLISELYVALESDLRVLAAIGVRTSFDRATELVRISPELTFAKKLNQLVTENHILQQDRDNLEILVNAGSAAAHRAWRPRSSDLSNMVDVLEKFLFNVVVPQPDVKKLKVTKKKSSPKSAKKK